MDTIARGETDLTRRRGERRETGKSDAPGPPVARIGEYAPRAGQITIAGMHEQPLRDQVIGALAELQDEQLPAVLEVLHMLRSKREILLLDEVDRRLLKAVAGRHCPAGPDSWHSVIDDYLNERISIGRAAELLGIPVLDLRLRFQKLGISLRWGAQSVEEAEEEINVAAALSASEKRQRGMSLGL